MDREIHDNITEMNRKGFWKKIKNLLFNVYTAGVLILIVVVLGAIQIFALVNTGGSARLYLSPEKGGPYKAGDTIDVELRLDPGGQEIVAVGAYINFDATALDIDCRPELCFDVFVSRRLDALAELQRVGDQVRIVAGSPSPITEPITVATLTFTVKEKVVSGDTVLDIDPSSSVILNDGKGSDTLAQVSGAVYTIAGLKPVDLRISALDYRVDFDGGCQSTVVWRTNYSATSEVFISEDEAALNDCFKDINKCTPNAGINRIADLAGVLNHSVQVSNTVCGRNYFFFASSTALSLPQTPKTVSDIQLLSTMSAPEKIENLKIMNLSADPRSRSVIIRWSTNKPADSRVEIGSLTESSSLYTYTHSLRVSGLDPDTQYTAVVVSSNDSDPEVSESITFRTLPEDVSLDANVVVRAARDRQCKSWLSCASQISVEDTSGNVQDMCFDLALCNQINPITGECENYVQTAQIEQQYSIFQGNPQASTIDEIQYLTGNVKVGAIWQGGASGGNNFVTGSLDGYFAFSAMRQEGSALTVPNGDFESKLVYPWEARFYNRDNPDAVYSIVQNAADSSDLKVDLNRVLKVRPIDSGKSVAGVKVSLGNRVKAGRQYYVSFDVRTDDPNIRELIVQFGYDNYRRFNLQSTDIVPISSRWQRVIAGPLEPIEADLSGTGDTYLGFLIDTQKYPPPYQPFYIDNVSIDPVLNVNSNVRIAKSCRGYATEDAPSCRFFDINSGKEYQGWEGYCIERDPRNERRCIQWLPIDVVAGSQSVISQTKRVGYGSEPDERIPLYYCVSARGNAPYVRERNIILNGYCKKGLNDFWRAFITYLGWSYGSALFPGGGIFGAVFSAKQVNKNNFSYGIYVPGGGSTEVLSDTSDKFLKEDLDRIVIRLFFARDDRDCTGRGDEQKLVLTPLNGFSDTLQIVHNSQKNEITYITVSRLDNGKFKIRGYATSGGAAGIIIGITADYYLREWCTTIAQVVDPFGNNAAWVERIRENSLPEDILDLRYTRNQDYLPFGAVVPPEPDYAPEEWDSTPDEPGRQPLYIEPPNKTINPQAPYQARAGSPYGVDPGIGVTKMCIRGKTGKLCTIDADCDVQPIEEKGVCRAESETSTIGQCEGGVFDGQICDTLNNDADCNITEPIEGKCGYPPGISYKVGVGTCVSGDKVGSTCTNNRQCGFDRETGQTGRCTGVVPPSGFKDAEDFLNILNSGIPGEERLAALFAKSQAIWRWDSEKNRYVKIEGGWDITQFIDTSAEPKGTCINGPNKGAECTLGGDECNREYSGARCVSVYEGVCKGIEFVTSCECEAGSVVDGSCESKACSLDGGITAGTCLVDTSYTPPARCNGASGFNAGKACETDADCSVAVGECYVSPYEINNRPKPPQVRNIVLKSSLDTIDEDGGTIIMPNGRSVTLSFNSIVDPNQVPLTRYTIDWGDGTITEESGLKIAPKSGSPHVITHTYFCNAEQDAADGAQDGVCNYQVKIQIEDNWGWCSGSVDSDGNVIENSLDPRKYSGVQGCDSWDYVSGSVKICTNSNAKGCNKSPIANAGSDQNLEDSDLSGDEEVTLNAGGSYDPDGEIRQYIWRDVNGNTIATGVRASVVLGVGTHTITLEVVDDSGESSTDTVEITITQPAPTVSIDSIDPVSGSGREPANINISYTVSQDCGLTAEAVSGSSTYSNSISANRGPGVISLTGLVQGAYTLTLRCSNSNGVGEASMVGYMVRGPVQAPQVLKFTSKDQSGSEKTVFVPGSQIVFELTVDDQETGDLEATLTFAPADQATRSVNRNTPEEFTYTYNTPGKYTVTATVKNLTTGLTSQSSIDITVVRWWNTNYQFRRRITVRNTGSVDVPEQYPVQITGGINTEKMEIEGTVRRDGNDFRVVYDTGSQFIELDRYLIDFNTPQTFVWFATVDAIPAGDSDSNYWIYYGNPSAGPAPSDISKVMQPRIDGSTVAVYYFEDGPGSSIVSDSTINTLNGSINGNPVWAAGKFGRSLQFDGIDDYVQINHSNKFNLPQGTIEFWVWHQPVPQNTFRNTFQTYFSKDYYQTPDPGHIYVAKTRTSNIVQYRLQDNTQSYYVQSSLFDPVQAGKWYHIAVSWGGQGMKLYIDGREVSNDPYTGGIDGNIRDLVLAANNYAIGKEGEDLIGFLNGRLDGFRISSIQRTVFPYAFVQTDPSANLGTEENINNPVLAFNTGDKMVAGVSDVNIELIDSNVKKQSGSIWAKISQYIGKITDIIW